MAWTKEQLEAIEARDCNMLVSAAAGSGKTAVLVNRIIERVMDETAPIDIDSIVVVTFTKAAAEEMKSRIAEAFRKRLEEEPGNSHLMKQIALVDHARISTIDSFCTYLLGNYYNSIDFDPAYRVADAGELELLKADVFNELLEDKFTEADKDFMDFVEAFASGKNLDRISEIVMRLHKFAESYPWQEEWLESCRQLYNLEDESQFMETSLYKNTVEYIRIACRESAELCKDLIDLCNEPLGPKAYEEAIKADYSMLSAAAECEDMDGIGRCLSMEFTKLKTIRASEDPELKEYVKYQRNNVKDRIKKIKEQYFSASTDKIWEMLLNGRKYVNVIIDLTKEYGRRYGNAKVEKNVVDFSDIEHLALKILVRHEIGTDEYTYTEIANELAAQYNEIYIDEYQDSNVVQETILTAISGERYGRPNIFMVGDVKQSIYKFRMAKPELFISKYDTYEDEGSKRKIELHSNFRSTVNVIETVNDVFFKVMRRGVGGVEYTKKTRLNYGGTIEDTMDTTTDILVAKKSSFKDYDMEDREICANMAAARIREMMDENSRLSYKDFVILLRSDKASGPDYAEILSRHDIPAKYDSTTGYFSATEVETVLNLLKIIDNPRQEIPLIAIMRSYFAYFSAEELAYIKGPGRRTEFYDCMCNYAKKMDSLSEKCRTFLDMIKVYREKARRLTISELISDIVYGSGYYDYLGLLDNSRGRRANLDMLVTKAADYEKTSYSGLFNFLRYIEEIRKYDVDYGEGPSSGGDENVVRIMSIHRSKGLEFPVVILGDASKGYNLMDVNGDIVIDSDFGLGINVVDMEKRIKYPSIIREMIRRKITLDNIGEELRILYVALTRAVQKLIVVGVASDTSVEAWDSLGEYAYVSTDFILNRKSYLDLVMAAYYTGGNRGKYNFRWCTPEEMVMHRTRQLKHSMGDLGERLSALYDECKEAGLESEIGKIIEYRYPHSNIFSLRSKYSVSDIKHKAMEESELEEVIVTLPEDVRPVPEFIEKSETVTGVFRGNAYHKFFEILDYGLCKDSVSVEKCMDEAVTSGRLSEEYRALLKVSDYVKFMESPLALRMKQASEAGFLYREQPFIMEIGADMVDASYPSDEKVLIQGIVDAFFFENDKVYIVDYKTDRVPAGDEGVTILTERYRKQLELYGEALGKITGREVGGLYIYSVALGREIEV